MILKEHIPNSSSRKPRSEQIETFKDLLQSEIVKEKNLRDSGFVITYNVEYKRCYELIKTKYYERNKQRKREKVNILKL